MAAGYIAMDNATKANVRTVSAAKNGPNAALQTAFFGGDPDNFTFPRHDIDMCFFRAYENGKPARTEHFLKWNTAGAADNEVVFVSGHPGSTDRMKTMDQLAFLRDMQYPWYLKTYKLRDEYMKKFAAESPEKAREALLGQMTLEDIVEYQEFKRFSAESVIKFTVDPDPK